MDAIRVRIEEAVTVLRRRQGVAHARTGPVLVLSVEIARHQGAELFQSLARPRHIAAKCTVLDRAALDRIAGNALAQKRMAHAAFLVDLLRGGEPDALHQRGDTGRDAGRNETTIAPGRAPADLVRLDEHDLPAPLGEVERRRAAGKTAADDHRLGLDLAIESGIVARLEQALRIVAVDVVRHQASRLPRREYGIEFANRLDRLPSAGEAVRDEEGIAGPVDLDVPRGISQAHDALEQDAELVDRIGDLGFAGLRRPEAGLERAAGVAVPLFCRPALRHIA